METGGGFSCDPLDLKEGFAVLRFEGRGAQAAFVPEAGGHRVQRIPPTERKGRVHSSTVIVAVLEVPVVTAVLLEDRDIKIEAYTGGGPGGQHRNRTATNIRIKHLPTGIEACANTKSHHQNRRLALELLRSRLSEHYAQAVDSERNQNRRLQQGSGNRASQKVRTVAYQRGEVVNHLNGKRIKIRDFENGEIDRLH